MSVNYEKFKEKKVPNLYLYCGKSKLRTKNYNDKCCHGVEMINCENKENHCYMVRARRLDEKNKIIEKQKRLFGSFSSVEKQAKEFLNQMHNQALVVENYIENDTVTSKSKLGNAVAFFISYKLGDNVIKYKRKDLKKEYIKEIECYLHNFLDSFVHNGYDIFEFDLAEICDNHIQNLIDYLSDVKKYSIKYRNSHFVAIKEFCTYMKENYNVNINVKSLFYRTIKKVPTKKHRICSFEDFSKIVELTTFKNGFYRKGKKQHQSNHYKKWLVCAFNLCLFTGRRREEVLKLKWSDIKKFKNSYLISGENFKVNRDHETKNIIEANREWTVPLYVQFLNYLNTIGFEENFGKDKYIVEIENRDEIKIETLKSYLTKGFTHFSRHAKLELELYDLKNTFISNLFTIAGDKTNILTNHSSTYFLGKHYLNTDIANLNIGENMKII